MDVQAKILNMEMLVIQIYYLIKAQTCYIDCMYALYLLCSHDTLVQCYLGIHLYDQWLTEVWPCMVTGSHK